MGEFIISQEEVIECADLDMLATVETSFNKICKKYHDEMGERFAYNIDTNYEDLTVEIKMEFKQEEDDYSEGNSQLN